MDTAIQFISTNTGSTATPATEVHRVNKPSVQPYHSSTLSLETRLL
ncbi:hypothetical protein GFS31_42230 (plasmid) [Leptolyngbya sp. BL0902]|nr:hypothetical protein GFS31_42230 [Leptolyngbya sp. BL0902]